MTPGEVAERLSYREAILLLERHEKMKAEQILTTARIETDAALAPWDEKIRKGLSSFMDRLKGVVDG